MVWSRLLPPQGGGGFRRWMRVRKDLFDNYMNPAKLSKLEEASSSEAIEDYRNKFMKPLTIFDFKQRDDDADARAVSFGPMKGGWRLSDDEVIGGYSRGSLEVMGQNLNSLDSSNDQSDDVISNNEHEQQQPSGEQPFIRWNGNIDTRIGPKSRAKRSGFCSIRCPQFPFGVPIGSRYNALEINCRTDGRVYTVNLKVSSYFPDDLYQALITVDEEQSQLSNKSEFLTLVLPFTDFMLTSGGLMREKQRYLDGGVHLEHLGFTLMDGIDGPFQFDLARIRAINYIDGVIIGDDEKP